MRETSRGGARWWLLAGAWLSGCPSRPPPPTAREPPPAPVERDVAAAPAEPRPVLVGGDRDAHGCIGSAGYSWCAREGRCVRPWELARERALPFEGSPEANRQTFDRYCNAASADAGARACAMPECFRAVTCCRGGCSGPAVFTSCCPCRADEVDAITCPNHRCGGTP